MNRIRITKEIIKRHFISWIFIMLLMSYFFPMNYWPLEVNVLMSFLKFIAFSFVYYSVCLFVMPFFNSKKYFIFSLLLTLIYLLFTVIYHLIDEVLRDYFNGFESEYSNDFWIFNMLVYFVLICGLAISFYQNQINIQKLEEQSKNERIDINQEISFMQNQFNAHISFSFLNYCYSFLLNQSPNTASIIETYSDMLHYTLDKNHNEKVLLKYEIEYIENFINLQKHFNKNLAVKFEIRGEIEAIEVLPRIFITLVENAFKHGICNNNSYPIYISLIVIDNELNFKVSNLKKTNSSKVLSTGIGKLNLVSQLDLFYKSKYKIEILETQNNYQCELIIQNLENDKMYNY